MTTTPETPTVEDAEIADLLNELTDEEGTRLLDMPLLKTWQAVLSNIETERVARITPGWAATIVGNWTSLKFSDVPAYHERYFEHLTELRQCLLDVIEFDPECLERMGADDIEENRGHYIEILLAWRLTVMRWELAWDCLDPDAAIEFAAIADASRLFLGEQGLIQHLGQREFQFTQEESDMLEARLVEALKEQ